MFEDLIAELQPFAHALVELAGRAGYQPRVTSTLRTRSEQARLYRRRLAGLSPYPALLPGTSPHEYGYAFDMILTPMEALTDAGEVWTSWGGYWPGAVDPVHFQFPGFVIPADAKIDLPSDVALPPGGIDEDSLAAFALDLGINFVPVYGTVTTVAGLADLFGVSHARALRMLASPTHYYNEIRRLMFAFYRS